MVFLVAMNWPDHSQNLPSYVTLLEHILELGLGSGQQNPAMYSVNATNLIFPPEMGLQMGAPTPPIACASTGTPRT